MASLTLFSTGDDDYSPYTLVPFQLRLVPCHLLETIYITCRHLEPTHSGVTTWCNGGVVGTHISPENTLDAQVKPEFQPRAHLDLWAFAWAFIFATYMTFRARPSLRLDPT